MTNICVKLATIGSDRACRMIGANLLSQSMVKWCLGKFNQEFIICICGNKCENEDWKLAAILYSLQCVIDHVLGVWTWTIYPRMGINDNNIDKLSPGLSIDQCKDICQTTPGCYGFDFRPYRACYTSSIAGRSCNSFSFDTGNDCHWSSLLTPKLYLVKFVRITPFANFVHFP